MTDGVRPGGTYKTLAEQREVLTPAEERFERARQTIGLILGPIAFLIMYYLPLPLDQNQQTLAAILSFTIVYWLSEAIPIPVTAVLALALCVLFNVPAVGPNAEDAPGDIVFGSFIDPVIFLFIGAFIIAQAMITHGLDRRFAFLVLSIPGFARSTYGVIIAFGAIAASISAFISNTTTAAMLLPIGLGMMAALGGMAKVIGNGIAKTFGFTSLAAVAAVSALIAIIISETTSNTASAIIVVPIVIPIANAAGLDPLVPALAAVFGASFGFMMPVSTPQNAVVYGSGMIPITKMVRSGLAFDIIGLILIVLLIPVMAGLILA
jgi:di/tricarboxylate transporter